GVAAELVLAGMASSILEVGAGRSSIIMARALAETGGGRITSVESAPQFCAREWAQVRQLDNVDSELLVGPVTLRARAEGVHYWPTVPRDVLKTRGPFDLVLIDAPHQSFGREASLHLAFPHLANPAVVVLDDACRSGERRAVDRWLARYPDLKLIDRTCDEKYGYAVLGSHGAATRWPGVGAWLSTVRERIRTRGKVRSQRSLESGPSGQA